MKHLKLSAQHSIGQKEGFNVNPPSECLPSLGCTQSHLPCVSSLHLLLFTPGYLWPCGSTSPQYTPLSRRTVSNHVLQIFSVFLISLTTKTALYISLVCIFQCNAGHFTRYSINNPSALCVTLRET